MALSYLVLRLDRIPLSFQPMLRTPRRSWRWIHCCSNLRITKKITGWVMIKGSFDRQDAYMSNGMSKPKPRPAWAKGCGPDKASGNDSVLIPNILSSVIRIQTEISLLIKESRIFDEPYMSEESRLNRTPQNNRVLCPLFRANWHLQSAQCVLENKKGMQQ